MSRFIVTTIAFLLVTSTTFAGPPVKLKAYIDQKTYYTPETGTYAEIHIQFVGYTLNYKAVEGGMQSDVSIHVAAVGEKGDTVASDAYVLKSPIMRDSVIEDFFDIVRFPLQPGKYIVHISLNDLQSTNGETGGDIELVVQDYTKGQCVSDILIAESAGKTTTPTVFSKSGMDILPRISNFYPTDLSNMPYYVEMYNSDRLADSVFAVKQRIVSTIDSKEMTEYTRLSKMQTAPVVPLMRNLDISKLPSGSYRLEISMLDRNSVTLGTPVSYYFERINEFKEYVNAEEIVLDPQFQASITDDSIDYYLSSLIPIARPAEIKNILAVAHKGDKETSRKHIQQFWLQTSGANATNAWLDYKKQVMLVESLYGNNFQEGFETDRGRVYLQYGPPNQIISRETSPTEYPYEIWHYYKIKVYSNKRFVFYNPDLVNKGYRLLHSDMVGEQQNYRWPQTLAKRNSSNQNIDDPNDGNTPHYGGNALQDYNLTR